MHFVCLARPTQFFPHGTKWRHRFGMFVTRTRYPDLNLGIFGESTKNWVGFFGKWTMHVSLQEFLFHCVSPPPTPHPSPSLRWCCPITHHITALLKHQSIGRAAVAANLHKTDKLKHLLPPRPSLHSDSQEVFLHQVALLPLCWLQGGRNHTVYLSLFTHLFSCCPPCCCVHPSPCLPATPTPSNPGPNV